MDTDAETITDITAELEALEEGGDAFDEDKYWDQEYGDFEETHLKTESFWRTPAHSLQGTVLFGVFERFCAAFPNHSHDRNTVFYLFNHGGSLGHIVLMRCTHFEHTSLEDLRCLPAFLDYVKANITTEGCAFLEMLHGETIHLKFSDPREEVIAILQERSTRRVA